MEPDIVLSNGIIKSTKEVEVIGKYAYIEDMCSGWTTYKVPIELYNNFKAGKLEYWDMVYHKKTKATEN